MMEEITLSLMNQIPNIREVMQPLLDEFEASAHIRVKLQILVWEEAHSELIKSALYHNGPDVSMIGTTRISDFIAMNALCPFSNMELLHIGRPDDFVKSSWASGHLGWDNQQYSIPWFVETYIIYYRKDLLKQAGIDETQAFRTPQAITDTARRLRECGVSIPFEFPLEVDRFCNLHSIASWVWHSGNEFCALDGKKVLFDQPQILESLQPYFGLWRCIAQDELKPLAGRTIEDKWFFSEGRSAMIVAPAGRYPYVPIPGDQANRGMAPLPVPGFVGGSNLVVWRHTYNRTASLNLIRFLTSPAVQAHLAPEMILLPSRLSILSQPPYATDPLYRAMVETVKAGRTYPSVSLWGLIQDRLVETIIGIGNEFISNPDQELDELVNKRFAATAHRLNLSLSS